MIYVPPPGIPEEIAAAMKRGAGFANWKESEVKRPAEKVKCATPLTLSTPSRTAPNLEANQKGTGKDAKKVENSGPLPFTRAESARRYAGYLTRPGRLRGDVPSALRIRNTNRARRYAANLLEMEKEWGKLAAVTLCYPTSQPSDLRAAEELLKAESQRLSGQRFPVLAVMQFDWEGLFHTHLALPMAALGSGCPSCGAADPWKPTLWDTHKSGEAFGYGCRGCGLTWRPVKEPVKWAKYLGSPVDSKIFSDRESDRQHAAGRYLLGIDALGRWLRPSCHIRRSPPSQALPSPFAALNLMAWLAAIIARKPTGEPRTAHRAPPAPGVPSITSKTPERRSNGPPGSAESLRLAPETSFLQTCPKRPYHVPRKALRTPVNRADLL